MVTRCVATSAREAEQGRETVPGWLLFLSLFKFQLKNICLVILSIAKNL